MLNKLIPVQFFHGMILKLVFGEHWNVSHLGLMMSMKNEAINLVKIPVRTVFPIAILYIL